MSKIVKAQNGLSFAIPIIRTLSQVFPRIGVLQGIFSQPKEVVGEKELNNAFRTYALKKSQELGKKSVERFTVPKTTSDEQSDATRVARPVVVPTRRDIDLHLVGTRAIPVYGKQSGTSTPVMGKKKKTRKARPTITRTPDAESTSVPVGSGAIAGSEDTAQRDTVRVTNGASVENANSQDTVKVQHENAENTEQTIDDRNILQRLGDRWARRKAKNSKPKTKEPSTNPPQENKGLVKRGFSYIKEHPIKSTLIGGTTVFFVGPKPFVGAWDVTSGIIKNRAKAWSFDENKDKDKLQNTNSIQKQVSVQNDTTQAYNGFLINQQNLVE